MPTAANKASAALELLATKPAQLSAILLCALLLTLPCVTRGLTSGYDSTTHAHYQHHFSQQFWDGELYPRWLAEENKGYGSPIFLIQYPLPYLITALLRPFAAFPTNPDREARELGLLVFIILAAAGVAAWHWFGKFAGPQAATLAAVAYMALPTFMVGIYLRAALGELCALIWMPLLFALCESMHKHKAAMFPLAAAFAMLIMSNVILTLPFVPALSVYAFFTGKSSGVACWRSLRRLWLALLLGSGMAGAYLLPVIAYRGFFNLDGLADNLADFEFGRYFLYFASGTQDHRLLLAAGGSACVALVAGWHLARFRGHPAAKTAMAVALLLGLSSMIPGLGQKLVTLSNFTVTSFHPYDYLMATMLLAFASTIFLGLIAYCRLPAPRDRRDSILLLIACLAFLPMLPIAAPVWKALPALKILQFPFRFGGILTVAVAGLIASSLNRHHPHERADHCFAPAPLVCLALIWVVGSGMLTCRVDDFSRAPRQTVQYLEAQDLDLMYRTYVAPGHLPAFARSLGTEPSSYFAAPAPGDGLLRGRLLSGEGEVDVVRENPRSLLVSANCSDRARLEISQLYFPLWRKVPLNGSSDDTRLGASTAGLVELPLSPGKQEFQLVFDGGSCERWGLRISVTSLLVSLLGYGYFVLRSMVVPND